MFLSKLQCTARLVSPVTPFWSVARNLTVNAAAEAAIGSKVAKAVPMLVETNKKDIPQSPFRMRFLAKLVREKWVPEALAQLKFSPKHKAVDVTKIIKVTSTTAWFAACVHIVDSFVDLIVFTERV
jgi:hypothetical protein